MGTDRIILHSIRNNWLPNCRQPLMSRFHCTHMTTQRVSKQERENNFFCTLSKQHQHKTLNTLAHRFQRQTIAAIYIIGCNKLSYSYYCILNIAEKHAIKISKANRLPHLTAATTYEQLCIRIVKTVCNLLPACCNKYSESKMRPVN